MQLSDMGKGQHWLNPHSLSIVVKTCGGRAPRVQGRVWGKRYMRSDGEFSLSQAPIKWSNFRRRGSEASPGNKVTAHRRPRISQQN